MPATLQNLQPQAAINLKPYQGLKRFDAVGSAEHRPASKAAINLKPYQGLKQKTCFRVRIWQCRRN